MTPTGLVASAASGKGKDAIRNLMGFMRLQARLEGNRPTFSKFLGLSVSPTMETETTRNGDKTNNAIVREDRFWFVGRSGGSSSSTTSTSSKHQEQEEHQEQQSLVFRYRFPPNNRLRHFDFDEIAHRRRGPNLATYTSILDEVTTLSIISAAQPNPRPGVSVTMQSQWGPGRADVEDGRPPPEEVDIVTTITKTGRTLGFVRAEVRDPSNNDSLICYFDHVKYLPTGWMLGLMLTPVGMWCLDLVLRYVVPSFRNNKESVSNSNSKNDDGHARIMDSFQQTSDTTATFRWGPQHANGIGGLHGGVQAILMERLGRTVAQNELLKAANRTSNISNNKSSIHNNVECERLQVSYQSSASKVLELRAHVIDPPAGEPPQCDASVTLRIEILRSGGPKSSSRDGGGPREPGRVVVSEGILTFANVSSKPKDQ
jgi:acyl-coenzyme A thioesterase PaaI-like protein